MASVVGTSSSSGSNSVDTNGVKARQHISHLRKHKFSIGDSKQNPLTQDLHEAVSSLSAELYTKDVHFLMELIQNAEDNTYLKGVEPALEFVLTTIDITNTGAPATLLVFNNELGFTEKNIDSICSVGRSTKKGLKNNGFIGEKGIGFKSVFLVSSQPHIFSNGYKVRFNELPVSGCGVGYIVPDWVDNNPSVKDIQDVYGTEKTLPTTTIILPVKPDKVEAVKKQLSEVHPEVLLFLTKIKRLSIREHNGDVPSMDSVSSVAIASDTSLVSLKIKTADSRIVQLSVQEGVQLNESTCRYFIWRESFPVKPDCDVKGRSDVREWEISLAFPFGERLKRGSSSVGIFAFLPTAMVSNFPFIIQADFILASSRENILLDNKWNLGILESVPSCFVKAITSCLSSNETSTFFSIARVLDFLPVRESSYKEFNTMRETIKILLGQQCIIPYESFTINQNTFCRPNEVIRICSGFRRILLHIKELDINLADISSLKKRVLHSSVDVEQYNEVLDFLGVLSVERSYSWYRKCIIACNLIHVPADMYMDILYFFCTKNVPSKYIKTIPLLKYIIDGREVVSRSFSEIKMANAKIHLVLDFERHSWLSKWNTEMQCPNNSFFFPDEIVTALLKHKWHSFERWLRYPMGVMFTSVTRYFSSLAEFVTEKEDPELAVSLAHFVYHANLRQYIQTIEMPRIVASLPIVDGSGKVHAPMTKTLVPASGSKWAKLFGSNPFVGVESGISLKYVDLGDMYGKAASFGSDGTQDKELLRFLVNVVGAIDLPNVPHLKKELDVANTELTKEQAILLLDWIRCLKARGDGMPPKFLESISSGKWLKTYSGFCAPYMCCLCDDDEEVLLLIRNVRQHFSVLDRDFYGESIKSHIDELKMIGVIIGVENMHVPVITHLQQGASFTMSKEWGIFFLHFIKTLKDKYVLREDLVNAAKAGKWIKSNRGYSSPVGSVLFRSNAEAILQITDLHVIDSDFYAGKIECFTDALELLGVVVDLEGSNLNLIVDNLKMPQSRFVLDRGTILLVLRCIKDLGPAATILKETIRNHAWIKTSYGLSYPSDCALLDKNWAHMARTITLPVINEAVYGSEIKKYKTELKEVGVVVDLDGISELLSDRLASGGGLTSARVISTLECIKCIGKQMPLQLINLKINLLGVKWLKTLLGYKTALDSVLFDSKWGTVVQYVDLPLIDEAFYGVDINSYTYELKMLGVATDFSEGAHFIAKGLRLPKEPSFMTADTALSLIQCVSYLRKNPLPPNQSLYEELVDKLKASKWVKTHLGYRSPQDTLLFDSEWKSAIEKYDAPFIDECFYTDFVSVEKADFKAMGVKVDIEEVCSGIYEMLNLHAQTYAILRIYKFLNMFSWRQGSQDVPRHQIWIPDHHRIGGKWVDSRECVFHDKDNLFHTRLYSLDKYYGNELQQFFKSNFEVGDEPSFQAYLTLWNDWVSSMNKVSPSECTFFWRHISENWNSNNEELLRKELTVLPATTLYGEGIELVDRSKLFIPDELQLKKLFTNATVKPLFVWCPRDELSPGSRTKLIDIYTTLGVRKISQSVQVVPNSALPVDCNFEVMDVDSRSKLVGKALLTIVSGFCSSDRVSMPLEARQKTVKTLLDVSVVMTGQPIEMIYMLKTHSTEQVLSVTVRRNVMWEKSSNQLIFNEASWNEQKNNIEFATDFARTISEGILPGKVELGDHLCKIIQMGFLAGFKEDDVDFLLMSENLELSVADRDFINSAFPHVYSATSLVPSKRQIACLDSVCTQAIPTRKTKTEII